VEQVLLDRQIPYECYKTKYEGHAKHLTASLTARLDAESGERQTSCMQSNVQQASTEQPTACKQPVSCERQTLIVVGGDGTINEVLSGIRDFDAIRLGVIPVGSGNDYARELHLDHDPAACICHILDDGEESTIDLGRVSWNQGLGERLFAISAGIGLDAIVCKKALTSRLKKCLNKFHLGKLTYLLLTVQTLFSMETANVTLTLPGKSPLSLDHMIFLAGMNFRAEGGGVPMAPHADHTDGHLDLCTAYGIPKWKTFFLLPLLVLAKHEGVQGISLIHCQVARLQTDRPMIVHADGEYCGSFTDVEFSILPGKLTIIR
jgi:YegS/Rv2252/BmrU family lipid kinase